MPEKFPGQIEVLDFGYEQVKALASTARSEVFAAMDANEARSIREVAEELDRSAAAVGEHVRQLIDAGLLMEAGTRKRRSRTEQLYVHRAKYNNIRYADQTPETIELYIKRFRGQMRRIEKEHELFHEAAAADSTLRLFMYYRWAIVYLPPESALKVKEAIQDLNELVARLAESDAETRRGGDYVRTHISTTMFPTPSESQRVLQRAKRQ